MTTIGVLTAIFLPTYRERKQVSVRSIASKPKWEGALGYMMTITTMVANTGKSPVLILKLCVKYKGKTNAEIDTSNTYLNPIALPHRMEGRTSVQIVWPTYDFELCPRRGIYVEDVDGKRWYCESEDLKRINQSIVHIEYPPNTPSELLQPQHPDDPSDSSPSSRTD